MRYIVYGTGPYCKYKIKSLPESSIIAFVDRKPGTFMGKRVYAVSEVSSIEYDMIVIMSRHLVDIIECLINAGVSYDKIIPGINIHPLTIDELEKKGKGDYEIKSDGKLYYVTPDGRAVVVSKEEDWAFIKNEIVSEDNVKPLKSMITKPVTKTYGDSRGGSIVRYYIDAFLANNRELIRGDVLEIGDNFYTERFKCGQVFSHVLSFNEKEKDDERVFFGNLINGEGLRGRQFDCIIMTQVLNFVEDIKNTPRIIVDALKPGGCALITVSGITPICRADYDDYGQYLSFTDTYMYNMFKGFDVKCSICTYGNLKSTCMFLAGMGCNDISNIELDYVDNDFQLVIAVIAEKKVG